MKPEEIQIKYGVRRELAEQLCKIKVIMDEKYYEEQKDNFKKLHESNKISFADLGGAIKYLDDLPWEF